MAYITVSNSKKMIRKLDPTKLNGIQEDVYARRIDFFSTRETANLKEIRELFRDPVLFMQEYYNPIEVGDSYKYVFPESRPSYHKDSTCEKLNSSFRNYEVPLPIREKGIDEVAKFRRWFVDNKCHEMEIAKYIEQIQLKFYIGPIVPASIVFENSGIAEREKIISPRT